MIAVENITQLSPNTKSLQLLSDKIVSKLNTLMAINSDRKNEYEMASQLTEDPDLVVLLSRFAQTSHQCRTDLNSEIAKLGGHAVHFPDVSPWFTYSGRNEQTADSFRDKKTVLNTCKQAEDKAADSYRAVFAKIAGQLSPDQQQMIRSQFTMLKEDYKKIKIMQSLMV